MNVIARAARPEEAWKAVSKGRSERLIRDKFERARRDPSRRAFALLRASGILKHSKIYECVATPPMSFDTFFLRDKSLRDGSLRKNTQDERTLGSFSVIVQGLVPVERIGT